MLVGSYSYVSGDHRIRETDYNLNRLVLQPDGEYNLVEGGTTKRVSDKKGGWRIVYRDPPEVLLDHAGYPIEIKANEVRLLVAQAQMNLTQASAFLQGKAKSFGGKRGGEKGSA
jgi:hypothetical protein